MSKGILTSVWGREGPGSLVTKFHYWEVKAVFCVSSFQWAFSRTRQALEKMCVCVIFFFFQTELKHKNRVMLDWLFQQFDVGIMWTYVHSVKKKLNSSFSVCTHRERESPGILKGCLKTHLHWSCISEGFLDTSGRLHSRADGAHGWPRTRVRAERVGGMWHPDNTVFLWFPSQRSFRKVFSTLSNS